MAMATATAPKMTTVAAASSSVSRRSISSRKNAVSMASKQKQQQQQRMISLQRCEKKRAANVQCRCAGPEDEAAVLAEIEAAADAAAQAVKALEQENQALREAATTAVEDAVVAVDAAEEIYADPTTVAAAQAAAAAAAVPAAAPAAAPPAAAPAAAPKYKSQKKQPQSYGPPESTIGKHVPLPNTDGEAIYGLDHTLNNHRDHLGYRWDLYKKWRWNIEENEGGMEVFSRGYEKYGFNRTDEGIWYREWAPGAHEASLIGDFNDWSHFSDPMTKNDFGVFEVFLPNNADGTPAIPHGSRVKIHMKTDQGEVDRIPAWIKMATQAPNAIPFDGIYYDPPEEERHVFQHSRPKRPKNLRIYEAHVGMSSMDPKVSTYVEFRDEVLPRIKKLGYNAVQFMAIQEHAFYGSFGYHVTNFHAPASRSGTPDELKSMIDKGHELGLFMIVDIVHSHASNNVEDGINMFDGTGGQYFHDSEKGYHRMWDSRCFNYGSYEVVRFLMSNLRIWMEEYKFDGFRFDGVTSMMYDHHGLGVAFTGNYHEYFGMATDQEAMVYMMLANDMLHSLYPDVITIAEDVSGMPALCRPVEEGGTGFDYRMNMAIADKWQEMLGGSNESGTRPGVGPPDEEWDMGNLVHTMTNRRYMEACVGYAECHDQALVGDKTIAFWLMDADMYDYMSTLGESSPRVDRGMALHKMIRLLTMALGGEGYLSFMGNEFGHPEWIDFPREDRVEAFNGKFVPGNGNSYHHCRRRWDLADANHLRYMFLGEFDRRMNHLDEAYEFVGYDREYCSRKDEGDKLIAFEKGPLVFVFNFHPGQSFTDYRIGCPEGGSYTCVFSSDTPECGGYSNLNEGSEHQTLDSFDNRPNSFLCYIPSRTCAVFAPTRLINEGQVPAWWTEDYEPWVVPGQEARAPIE